MNEMENKNFGCHTGDILDISVQLVNDIKIMHFSSPEPLGYGVRQSVRPQFQRSCPLKPLGQSKPNFIEASIGRGDQCVHK